MELDKNEFFDVYRQFKPDSTREEYEAEWEEFQRLKRELQRKREIQ